MTALDVQRSIIGCRAENQTAWPILVVRVVFDDFAVGYCFANLLYADVAQDALVDGVSRELELARFDLLV